MEIGHSFMFMTVPVDHIWGNGKSSVYSVGLKSEWPLEQIPSASVGLRDEKKAETWWKR